MTSILEARGGVPIPPLPRPAGERGRGIASRRALYLPAMIAAAVLVACSVALLVLSEEEAGAAFPGKNGRIAFDSYRGGITENVYTIGSTGKNLKRLTSNPVGGSSPAYSPDGKRIAFRHGNHVATVRADGSGLSVLGPGFDPDWSPDGDQLAFAANEGRRTPNEIYKMNADGSGEAQLTHNSVYDTNPSWQPVR